MDNGTLLQIFLGALFAFLSILFSVFCGLLGIYARYKTTNGYSNAGITKTIYRANWYIFCLMTLVTIGIAVMCWLMRDNGAASYRTPVSIAIFVLSLSILFPAYNLVKSMD